MIVILTHLYATSIFIFKIKVKLEAFWEYLIDGILSREGLSPKIRRPTTKSIFPHVTKNRRNLNDLNDLASY